VPEEESAHGQEDHQNYSEEGRPQLRSSFFLITH